MSSLALDQDSGFLLRDCVDQAPRQSGHGAAAPPREAVSTRGCLFPAGCSRLTGRFVPFPAMNFMDPSLLCAGSFVQGAQIYVPFEYRALQSSLKTQSRH